MESETVIPEGEKSLTRQLLELNRWRVRYALERQSIHEVRSPLNALHLNLQLVDALRDDSPKELPRLLQNARRDLRRTVEAIDERDELLGCARLEESPERSLERVLDAWRRHATRAGLEVSGQTEVPPALPAGSPLLSQLVGNAVLNALAAAPGGSALLVDSRLRGGCLELRVVDSGPGIATDLLAEARLAPWRRARAGLGIWTMDTILSTLGGALEVCRDSDRTSLTATVPTAGA